MLSSGFILLPGTTDKILSISLRTMGGRQAPPTTSMPCSCCRLSPAALIALSIRMGRATSVSRHSSSSSCLVMVTRRSKSPTRSSTVTTTSLLALRISLALFASPCSRFIALSSSFLVLSTRFTRRLTSPAVKELPPKFASDAEERISTIALEGEAEGDVEGGEEFFPTNLAMVTVVFVAPTSRKSTFLGAGRDRRFILSMPYLNASARPSVRSRVTSNPAMSAEANKLLRCISLK
mmetsp:Transcript_38273/g.120499  ORF Transcript_38273/g.120499 Transcript_38273/m.120499 type:complete len:236 (-) Transcript_38273:765-1472(-)